MVVQRGIEIAGIAAIIMHCVIERPLCSDSCSHDVNGSEIWMHCTGDTSNE